MDGILKSPHLLRQVSYAFFSIYWGWYDVNNGMFIRTWCVPYKKKKDKKKQMKEKKKIEEESKKEDEEDGKDVK